ncbi:hypothetical protein P154DRAFT_323281 [Amniculicola lignicola CBS 123094]|uniref:Uncharacterized protein n=1 Tax=Amniculicola lignicola CBS 123094 TaxID=1392246 RepID=A0A6A5W2Y9_9PLEO|nr:hypothetical protein P154DRAFT_323281 [Amniculicola lignicola CBS 123094]
MAPRAVVGIVGRGTKGTARPIAGASCVRCGAVRCGGSCLCAHRDGDGHCSQPAQIAASQRVSQHRSGRAADGARDAPFARRCAYRLGDGWGGSLLVRREHSIPFGHLAPTRAGRPHCTSPSCATLYSPTSPNPCCTVTARQAARSSCPRPRCHEHRLVGPTMLLR